MAETSYSSLLAQARHQLQSGQWQLAKQTCASLLEQKRDDPVALSLMAQTALATFNFTDAIKSLERCVNLAPQNLPFHVELGATLIRAGQFKQAAWCFENAQKLFPNDAEPVLGLAEAHYRSGNVAKARDVLSLYRSAGTETPVMAELCANIELDAGNPLEAARLLERHDPNANTQPSRFFTVGRAYERLARFDKAWEAYTEANRRSPQRFDLPAQINQLKLIQKYSTRETLATAQRASDRTLKPIFLIGRPRSGTTLLQTILSGHPNVTAIGETTWLLDVISSIPAETGVSHGFPQSATILNQTGLNRLAQRFAKLVRASAPLAETIVDKTLYNYKFLGLVQLLFPHAKIVYCKRDPLDLCFAAYAEDLRTHGYAVDLHRIGIMHRLFDRMMNHWKSVLDLPILEIEFESILAQQEATTRTLVDFCGLDWNDKCLAFRQHAGEAQLEDAVGAPNLSIGIERRLALAPMPSRAKNFEKYLAPLHDGFAEGERLIAQHGL